MRRAEQGIERLWRIEELSVRDNSLVDISGLSTLTALRELHLDVNKIASLDVSSIGLAVGGNALQRLSLVSAYSRMAGAREASKPAFRDRNRESPREAPSTQGKCKSRAMPLLSVHRGGI
jgi:Leucine-rich repeat (LRR) protein